ncbi:MAG: cell division FtsZ family protein [candidate division WOR-3 bacterium]|nr:cell division FtsZ family protein [candidate division WOR-3 bacterium]MCX7837609.1 cell division FtsZ family protein [candidate division WOR-3 bacterium]MDW8113356.1 cell division protein FtsZ [candidate division WOR-3 bacterium]
MIYPCERMNKLKIKIFGIGGGGGNILNTLINYHRQLNFQLDNICFEYCALNTDIISLKNSLAINKIQLGKNLTQGFGSGGKPEIGEEAAIESEKEIREKIKNTDLLILISCLGKGTGSGATPKIAEWAKEENILTLIMVVKPFNYEGNIINKIAKNSLEKIENFFSSIIVVSNTQIKNKLGNVRMEEAFSFINGMLAVGLTDLMKVIDNSHLIGIDFADIKNMINEKGRGLITYGEGEDEEKVCEALFNSPLFDNNIKYAKNLLLWVFGNEWVTLETVSRICERISKKVNGNTKIQFTFLKDKKMSKKIRAGFFATGLFKEAIDEWEKDVILEKLQEDKIEKALELPNPIKKEIDKNNMSLPTILRMLF